MLKNHLATAFRTLRRHKGFALVNVAGLALGIACCVLIGLYVRQEHSFDRFHTKAERIYRLDKVVTPTTGATERHAISSGQMGPAMVQDFPEVRKAVRVLPWFDPVLLRHDETALSFDGLVFADASFFDVFDFQLARGHPETALAAPRSIVLTPSAAQRLFGEADPMGRTLTGLGNLTYTVTGIAEEAPATSHLAYDALVSWSTTVPGNGALDYLWMNNWLTQVLYTYVVLAEDADPDVLEAKLPAFMERHFAERADQYHLYLQPLTGIHLGTAGVLHGRTLRLGSDTAIRAFGVVALLVLLLACFNFTNLATARAARRAREVGVRKALGAQRSQLVRQFLSEAALLTGAALLVAVLLVHVARPAFNALTGSALTFAPWQDPSLLGALAVLGLVVSLVAGGYPAFVLSGFRPVAALAGRWQGPHRGVRLRHVLVTAQFAVSIALVAATAVVVQQVRYVQTKSLGFDEEQLVVLPLDGTAMEGRAYETFRQELLTHPGVSRVSGSQSVPGGGTMSFTLHPEGKPDDEQWEAQVFAVDHAFLDTYRMTTTAGRTFSADRAQDSTRSVIINEALARHLGWDEPVGRRLAVEGEVEDGMVIGVVEDFHVESLRRPIEPLLMHVAPQKAANLTVRLSGTDLPGTLTYLRRTWERFEPAYPFDYVFLDESFAQQYETERRLVQTLGLFAGLALAIACLGLLGLAALDAQRRTKEIGIRKVLGASVTSIVALLSKDFARLVGAALVVGAPAAYLGMQRWLEGFAYRIEIGPGVFIAAGGAALLVALLAVSTQAVRAALANPVDSLRHE